MNEQDIRAYALDIATIHLQQIDFLSVVERLDDEEVEYTDEDAERIHNLIVSADVTLPATETEESWPRTGKYEPAWGEGL